jgi:hypothetical protein
MESHTEALEVVCRHYKTEFAEKSYSRMKVAKVKTQKENSRLRKKVDELERALRACRGVIELQANSIALASRARQVIETVLEEYL